MVRVLTNHIPLRFQIVKIRGTPFVCLPPFVLSCENSFLFSSEKTLSTQSRKGHEDAQRASSENKTASIYWSTVSPHSGKLLELVASHSHGSCLHEPHSPLFPNPWKFWQPPSSIFSSVSLRVKTPFFFLPEKRFFRQARMTILINPLRRSLTNLITLVTHATFSFHPTLLPYFSLRRME